MVETGAGMDQAGRGVGGGGHRAGGKMCSWRVYAYRGDCALAGGVEAERGASAAPSLWETHAVLAGLVGGLDL